MPPVSLARVRILAVAGTLALGACDVLAPGTDMTGTAGTGSSGTAGTTGTAGTGSTGTGGTVCGPVGTTTGAPGFGSPTQGGSGTSIAKYFGTDVTRDGNRYRFITNWWGTGWTDANVSYNGTAFTVSSATGTSMPDGTPIGYPAT
jgi:hypothetical protein